MWRYLNKKHVWICTLLSLLTWFNIIAGTSTSPPNSSIKATSPIGTTSKSKSDIPLLSSKNESTVTTNAKRNRKRKSVSSAVNFIERDLCNDELRPSFVNPDKLKTQQPENLNLNQTSNAHNENSSTFLTTSTKRKKKKKNTKKKSVSSSAKGGDILRRIKREWRDAVKMGIAYDWINSETISTSSSASSQRNDVRIGPWGKNLLHWHFSVQGPSQSVYANGVYHGVIVLPKDYPNSPPRVLVLTPSGRFIPGHAICLSASNFHPESWTPRWTILALVDALRIHMLTTENEIGGKRATYEQRLELANLSRHWTHGNAIDHERMIQEGIFPLHTKEEADEEEKTEQLVDSNETSKAVKQKRKKRKSHSYNLPSVRQTQQVAPVRDQSQTHSKLTTIIIQSVLEVLTSRTRLVVLSLVTIFLILNRR